MFLILSLLLALTTQFHGFSNAKLEYSNCSATTYNEGTTYNTNLFNLLDSLYQNALNNGGFYDTSIGTSPNQVFGLIMCFVDSSPIDCAKCLQDITSNTTQPCPVSTAADIFFDNCLLRYSNQNFTSVSSSILGNPNQPTCFANFRNVTNSTEAKNELLSLMGNLRSIAPYAPQKFAIAKANGTNFTGLIECRRDLTSGDCDKCIGNIITYMPSCSENWTSQGMRILDLDCYIRYESYFYNASAFPKLLLSSYSQPPSGGGSKSNLVVIVTTSISAAFVILVAIGIIFWRRRQKLHKKRDKESPIFVQENMDSTFEHILNPDVEYQVFDLITLQNATENFSDANKLGRGGFGVVYKGTLPDGKEIAVKRLSGSSSQGIRELKNEVELLAKLKHKNLVQLYGCCIQKEEKILCYEYVTNGSLDKILFEAKDGSKHLELDWINRYKIIEGITRGLHYLHEESRLKIVHRDLKGSNILLDKDMNPKISDFGLARFFDDDQTHKDTSIVAGTFGYMAPEYVLHGNYSTKSDVFSFGVLVLEIVTGKRNSSFSGSSRISNVISYALQHWSSETMNQLKDPRIEDMYLEEVKKCVHIALLCVQDKSIDRPNMEAVNLMLSSYSKTLPPLPSGWQISRILDFSLSDDYSTTQSSIENLISTS